MLIRLIILGLSFFSIALVEAQERGRARGINFTCMLWEGDLKEELYFRDGEKFTLITPYKDSRSIGHTLKSSEQFMLYVKKKDAEGQDDGYQLVGQSALPSETQQVLFLLFMKPKSDKLRLKILPIDDSIEGFPAGTFRFANFSKVELSVKFAGEIKKIPPREMTIMKSKVDKKGGLVPFLIGNKKGETIFKTRLFAQASGREIVFISPPKKEGSLPSVRFLPQLLPRGPVSQ